MRAYPTPQTISQAAAILQQGGLVAFPTETVYGLGANALDATAVAKIFEVKERPFFDPLIVHISDLRKLPLLARDIPLTARKLIDAFWPGPLTIVLQKTPLVPDIVTAGLDTVAIRMPAHPIARQILSKADIPIAAPSANRFGMLSPTCADHVESQLGEKVELIVDGGKCEVGIESTIIKIAGNSATLLRYGGIPLEDIEKVIKHIEIPTENNKIESPGQLPTHYAPRTPLMIIETPIAPNKEIAYLAFCNAPKGEFLAVEVLSPHADFREAAANLFSCLHRLDSCGARMIVAETVPEIGLGRAIMDRIKKAAKKNSC
ncbi:MAG: L-threonylcarbamoyladenylate synthase [Spirochaetes bacterium]|nr:L-threonylcarbamoyladenylate synthase [Spirochaetota bacterium]